MPRTPALTRLLLGILIAIGGCRDAAGPDPEHEPGPPREALTVLVRGTSLMLAGKTARFTPIVEDSATGARVERPVSWGSSDPGVASVTGEGVVTANRVGAARITLTAGGRSASVDVRVVAAGYRLTLLGAPGGPESYANGINDAGQVVGTLRPLRRETRAFLWETGRMTELAGVTGWTEASAINNLGQVAGRANGRPVLWEGGRVRVLAESGYPWAINDRGQVLIGGDRPLLWEDGRLDSLPGLRSDPRYSWISVVSMNGRGDLVGYGTSGGTWAVLRFRGGASTVLWSRRDGLGVSAINDRGMVVGHGQAPGCPRDRYSRCAVLWEGGRLRVLSVDDHATDLNEKGQVVGSGPIPPPGQPRSPWIWEDGRFTQLQAVLEGEGWELLDARAIDESGRIVGSARREVGAPHPVLLTPP